jgi:hypothetical protein
MYSVLTLLLATGLVLSSGCGTAVHEQREPRDLTVLVGPFTMEVAISHSDKIHSFTEPPSSEDEPEIRQRLVADVTLKAQRLLTDHLSRQDSFAVTSLHEAKRIETDVIPSDTPMSLDLLRAMGRVAGTDIVLYGRILGYGQLPLRYWLTGWAVTASSQLAIVGAATGGNLVAMGSYLGFDILTDLPLWTGGFYAFGWAFRPVLVDVEAWQLTGCEQQIWNVREFALLGHKYLEMYPEPERKKKEIQLEANLTRAMEELARRAGESLRLQPCPQNSEE